MVRLKMKELAVPRGFNIAKISREAKLDIRLVRRYWHNQIRSVSLDALKTIAAVLGVHFLEMFDCGEAPTGKNFPELKA